MSSLLQIAGPNSPAGADPQANLLFLHGLGGDQKLTWTARENAFWPGWLAEMFSDLAVFSVGYEASPSGWLGSTMPISDRALQLLALLEARQLLLRPNIFVVHSLGGLVMKEMIRIAETYQNKAWETLARRTLGVVFLATPHSGSRIPDYLNALRRLLRLSVSVRELEANAAPLRDLNLWYRNNARRLEIQTRVFYETQTTNGVRVVDEVSADPGIAGVFPIAVDADHISICKLDTQNTLVFSSVANFVRELTTRPSPIKPAIVEPEFTMIRLFSGNQPQGSEPWREIRDDEFEQQTWESAADPVFDIMAENNSGSTLVIYGMGIHLLERKPGTGGTGGYPQRVEVQSELTVHCPQKWKETSGVINDTSWVEEFEPIEMKKDDSPFRFTLKLENFCDEHNASSSEVRFCLTTRNGMIESRSIWLHQ